MCISDFVVLFTWNDDGQSRAARPEKKKKITIVSSSLSYLAQFILLSRGFWDMAEKFHADEHPKSSDPCLWLAVTYARKFKTEKQPIIEARRILGVLRHQYRTFWLKSQTFLQRGKNLTRQERPMFTQATLKSVFCQFYAKQCWNYKWTWVFSSVL